MVLRSDEEANQAEVERDKRFRSNVGKAAVTTATGLGAAAGAGSLASKVMPFLNQYIPSALAVKGINKISPKLGSFLKKGQEMGLNIEEGLNFIKEKFGRENPKEPAKENRNILEQYSPELLQFIKDELDKGTSPLEAGAAAQLVPKFKKAIKQMEKDHKIPFSAILETTFGQEQGRQEAFKKFKGNQKKQTLRDELLQQVEGAYPQQNQQNQPGAQAGNQGDASLLAAIDKILKM